MRFVNQTDRLVRQSANLIELQRDANKHAQTNGDKLDKLIGLQRETNRYLARLAAIAHGDAATGAVKEAPAVEFRAYAGHNVVFKPNAICAIRRYGDLAEVIGKTAEKDADAVIVKDSFETAILKIADAINNQGEPK